MIVPSSSWHESSHYISSPSITSQSLTAIVVQSVAWSPTVVHAVECFLLWRSAGYSDYKIIWMGIGLPPPGRGCSCELRIFFVLFCFFFNLLHYLTPSEHPGSVEEERDKENVALWARSKGKRVVCIHCTLSSQNTSLFIISMNCGSKILLSNSKCELKHPNVEFSYSYTAVQFTLHR